MASRSIIRINDLRAMSNREDTKHISKQYAIHPNRKVFELLLKKYELSINQLPTDIYRYNFNIGSVNNLFFAADKTVPGVEKIFLVEKKK